MPDTTNHLAPAATPQRVLSALVLSALTLVAPRAARAQARDLATLFPQQAIIHAPAGRFVRLELPPTVLERCRADLSDLRVFDRQGREVPYLLDRGDASAEGLEIIRSVTAALLAVRQHTEQRDNAPQLRVERYELDLPEALRQGSGWQLVIDTARRHFVRQVRVSQISVPTTAGSNTGAREAETAEGERQGSLLATGSFFRLSDPPRERTRLALPDLGPTEPDHQHAAHDASQRLVLTLEGEAGDFLAPSVHFEQTRTVGARLRVETPLVEIGRERRDQQTVVVLERPRGLLLDLLRLHTPSTAFNRRVEVWDEGPNRVEGALGHGRLLRIPTTTMREQLDLALLPASGDRLRVVIDDGDSPPLEALAFGAVARAPALLFALRATPGSETQAILRFGGARAHRPRYDDAALVPSRTASGAEDVRSGRYDPALVLPAHLGPVESNPAYDPAPVLAFARGPGAAVDAGHFRWHRRIEAHPSAEGLVRVPLTPEDLAVLRADLADLRVIDGSAHQHAFVRASGGHVWRELEVTGPSARDGVSRYSIRPPVAPVRIEQLSLAADAPFFDRAFTLDGRSADRERRPIASGRIRRQPGDPRPWRIDLPAERFTRLELRIEDGNDAPLAFRRAAGRFPVPEIYFAAEAGSYQLLLGDPLATPPSYELETLRRLVLALDAGSAELGVLEDNPEYKALSRLRGSRRWQGVFLWAALAAAVAFLAWISLRLARDEGS